MNEIQLEQQKEDFKKITDQLQDTQHYCKEIKILHGIDALILASLVVIVFQTFSYLVYGMIRTDLDATLYMFSLLIGPAAFFLLLLHLYELYGFAKRGEKSLPLTLDLMYLLYITIACVTMVELHFYYLQHHISQNVLTIGWGVAVALLCAEVPLALFGAKFIVTMFVSRKLPHFFEHQRKSSQRLPRLIQQRHFKPKQVYYFRKKPDISLWQNEEFFIRYHQ
jgi:hypothetical protein